MLYNYNYIEEEGVSYIPVFKDGKFEGFRELEKIYDKYGIYKGAKLKPAKIRLDLNSLRAFNLFNFKNLPDAKKVVQEAIRGTDFDKISVNFNDWHENNMQKLIQNIEQENIEKYITYKENC